MWRGAVPALTASGRTAYAVNLLGLGKAAKPAEEYSIELWADQVEELATSVPEPVVLVGNSLGSLVCLEVARRTSLPVALYNCAVGMNSKARPLNVREWVTWPVSWAAQPVFWLVDRLLQSRVAPLLFDAVRGQDTVKQVLQNVYKDATRVDDALVDMIVRPAADPGALDAFVAIFTGDPGPRPEGIVAQIDDDLPIAVIWGDADIVTPIDGPVATFFRRLPAARPNASFTVLADTGHVPFDERPDLALPPLLDFLDRLDA